MKYIKNNIKIESLNEYIENAPEELVKTAEKNYYMQIEEVARKISKNKDAKILLLAGPSASTKTTTSKKLSSFLEKYGIHSVFISLDDFYKNRQDLPLLGDGSIDYETIDTLDLDEINRCFKELIEARESKLPIFDFPTGMRAKEKRHIKIEEHSVLIIEGLHALNPIITENYDSKNFLKVYISPASSYVLDGEVVLDARDIRLVRRMIRDFFHRGSSVENTLNMWINVIQAEMHSIIPFRETADFLIDSTILYEPCIYMEHLLPILIEYEVSEEFQEKVEQIKDSLSKFKKMDHEYIPTDTVLKEFIG